MPQLKFMEIKPGNINYCHKIEHLNATLLIEIYDYNCIYLIFDQIVILEAFQTSLDSYINMMKI